MSLSQVLLLIIAFGLAALLVPIIQVLLQLKDLIKNLNKTVTEVQGMIPEFQKVSKNLAQHSETIGEPIGHVSHITGQVDTIATKFMGMVDKFGTPAMKYASIFASVAAGLKAFKKILPNKGGKDNG